MWKYLESPYFVSSVCHMCNLAYFYVSVCACAGSHDIRKYIYTTCTNLCDIYQRNDVMCVYVII